MKYIAVVKTKSFSVHIPKPTQQEAYELAKKLAEENPGCYWAVIPYEQ